MTTQEAERMVAQLMRIWQLRWVDEWGFFDEHFYLRTQYDSSTLLDINPLIELKSCDLIESIKYPTSYQRISPADRPYLSALENGEMYEGSVQGADTNAEEAQSARGRAEFCARWRPVLRRNCWLMGYDIEASSEEKTQWRHSLEEVVEVAPSQVVSDHLRGERRRVAAAFGVAEWQEQYKEGNSFSFVGRHNGYAVCCTIDEHIGSRELRIQSVDDSNKGLYEAPSCRVLYDRCDGWYFVPCAEHPQYNQIMSHGLYRLGLEREALSPKLKAPPLSTHEKLELRLSLPREFWPKTWWDEETDATK